MTTNRPPRRRQDSGRRDELLDAAARVVARQGVAAASTRRIAEEAGLPQGLVHYWFTGRDELLEELVLRFLREFETTAIEPEQKAGEEPGEEADHILERLRTAFEVVREDDPGRHLAMYELTTWALRTPEARETARRQYAAYHEVAARLAEPWLRRHGGGLPVGADVLAQFLVALFDGVVLGWLADPQGAEPDEVFRLVSHLFSQPCDEA